MSDIKAKKNIFIGGVARSGKSTISKKLCEKSACNHFPVDYIAASFKRNFPDCGINDGVIINESSINLSLFLSTVIGKINKTNEKYIIDSAHIMPKDIIKYLDKEKWDIYFIGYPNIEPEEKFNNIRKYDSKVDWTSRQNNENMMELVKGLIEISKKIEDECKKYDIRFIDTSKNFFDTIDQAVIEILNNNSLILKEVKDE